MAETKEAFLKEIDRLKARVAQLEKAQPGTVQNGESPHNQHDSYRSIAQAATDAFVTIDQNSTILTLNPAAEQIFGYSLEQMLGQSLTMLMPEYLRALHKAGLERFLSTGCRYLNWNSLETYGLHQKGHLVPVEIAFGEFKREGETFFSGIVRDITLRKRSEQYLALQYAFAQLLTETSDLNQAIASSLALIGERLNWQLGIYWQVDLKANVLRPTQSWHQPTYAPLSQLQEFEQTRQSLTFSPGVELPGRIWHSTRSLWVSDTLQDPDFPPGQAGLRSAFGFPVKLGPNVLGVLEFFSSRIQSEDISLLQLMTVICNQLGQFIERKRAEENTLLLVRAVAASTSGILITDPHQSDNPIIYASPGFEGMTGYAASEIRGRNCRFLQGVDSGQEALVSLRQAIREAKDWSGLLRNYRKDGSLFWNELRVSPVFGEQGEVINFVGVQLDVTRRKEAEEALNRREQEFKALVEKSPDIVARVDLEGRNLYINPAMQAETGVGPEVLLGKTPREAGLGPKMVAGWETILSLALHTGQAQVFEYSFPDPSLPGELKYFQSRVVPEWQTDNGEHRINSFLVITRNITQLKQAQLAFQKERDFVLQIMNTMGQGLSVTNREGHFEFINAPYAQMLGYKIDEILGRTPFDITPVEDHYLLAEARQRRLVGESNTYETRLLCKNGREIYVTITGVPRLYEGQIIGSIAVITDLTERRQEEERRLVLERKLLQMQKLESLGVLAGGIAHDFNNTLTAIVGNLGLARLELLNGVDRGQVEELLADAEKGAFQARRLTGQLLTFARGGAPLKQWTHLEQVLQEEVRFALRGSSVSTQFNLAPDLWPVEIDRGQIAQVVHNLVLNAAQAMPKGGRLWVEANNLRAEGDKGEQNLASLVRGEPYVEVKVRDEGRGIDAEVLPRIFDPYFTTKQQGNGLGLAMVFSIISQHQGFITATSQVGQGTTFSFYLPAAGAKAVPKVENTEAGPVILPKANTPGLTQVQQGQVSPGSVAMQKHPRILVVDDEKAIRIVLTRVLTQLGYEVDSAAEGATGVELYRQGLVASNSYALVIIDLTIPGGMGGEEAVKELLILDPLAKVIVASGYADGPILSQYQKYGFKAILPKPFNLAQVRHEVEEVLREDSLKADKA